MPFQVNRRGVQLVRSGLIWEILSRGPEEAVDRRHEPSMKRSLGLRALEDLGFRGALGSVHASRTVMLKELSLLLDGVSPDAPASRYRGAIVEDNILGKATRSTRLKTTEHLTALY